MVTRRCVRALVVGLALSVCASPAAAQQSLTDALSFLLINRSIPTGDFLRDELAAAQTRDTIIALLRAELARLPINTPASGFTYRLDPDLGTVVRSSNHFGPFFLERALTSGRRQASLGLSYTQSSFDTIDSRNLLDGTLVATASQLEGEPAPFDAETLTLRIQSRILTLSGHYGFTDRLDVVAAIPLVTVNFTGERIDTYRGTALMQASAVASATGLGDIVVRGKYHLLRIGGGGGIAFVGDVRFPTGDSDNLLGGGELVFTPRVVGSFEQGRFAVHAEGGVATGGVANEVLYGGGVTFAATPRFTVVFEALGRTLDSGGRLVEITEPHPDLVGVSTIRLTGTLEPVSRLAIAAGLRWNVAARSLLSVNVLRPVTSTGLNAPWVGTVTFDYAFGR